MKQRVTDQEKIKELDTLVQRIWDASESSFYRTIWHSRPQHITSRKQLGNITPISQKTLAEYPFLDRCYTSDPGLLTKFTYHNSTPLLVGRTFNDIAQEQFGVSCERPLLLFATQNELLEKSIWYYEQNLLPLLCNSNPEITAELARQYEIDCIVCDIQSLTKYLPAIVQKYNRANIKDVFVIDESFDTSFLFKQFEGSRIHLAFTLPETGTIAVAHNIESGGEIVFTVDEHTLIECHDDALTISRTLALPTPLIRYRIPYRANKSTDTLTDIQPIA